MFSSGEETNFFIHLNVTKPAMYLISLLSDSRALLAFGIDVKSGKVYSSAAFEDMNAEVFFHFKLYWIVYGFVQVGDDELH